MARPSVVICGGGIAGVEALLRMRRLAGDDVDITLVSPATELVYRPLTVVEPFDRTAVRRYPMARIAADTGARWLPDALGWLDRDNRVVHTRAATAVPTVGYDALLLAVGAHELDWSPFADTFSSRDAGHLYRSIIGEIATGQTTRLAFVLPPGPVWPLPLYELAMITARFARYDHHDLQITFAIADAQPLPALGPEAGRRIAQLLGDLDIALHTGTEPSVPAPGRLRLHPGQPDLQVDRIITLPILSGPDIAGVPGFAYDRFVHVDEHCRVLDTDGHIFAAGDATNQPVKQGGISAQQADTAAAAIVHLLGLGPAPQPLRPHIEAKLLTGAAPLYFSAHVIDGRGWQATFYDQPPWPAGEKVIAEELGPYLSRLDDEVQPGPTGAHAADAPRSPL